MTDKNSYESASGQSSESRKLETDGVSYAASSKKAETKAKLEVDGITAEKAAAVSQVSVMIPDVVQLISAARVLIAVYLFNRSSCLCPDIRSWDHPTKTLSIVNYTYQTKMIKYCS